MSVRFTHEIVLMHRKDEHRNKNSNENPTLDDMPSDPDLIS